jgi:hypothetical protein
LKNSEDIVRPHFIRRRGEILNPSLPGFFQFLGLENQAVIRPIGSEHFGGVFNAHGQNEALIVVGMISEDFHPAVGGA